MAACCHPVFVHSLVALLLSLLLVHPCCCLIPQNPALATSCPVSYLHRGREGQVEGYACEWRDCGSVSLIFQASQSRELRLSGAGGQMCCNRNVLEVLSCSLGESVSQTRPGGPPGQQAPGLGCGLRPPFAAPCLWEC